MRTRLPLTLVILTLARTQAHADFVLSPPNQPNANPETPPKTEQPASQPQLPARQFDPLAIHTKAKKTILARGFGTQIPLSFAVRQIVPAGIKIIYGPGANQNTPVDWQGGKSWTVVLSDAIRPIGLTLTSTAHAITIRR